MSTVVFYATPTGVCYHRDALCLGLNSYHMANGGTFETGGYVPTVTRAEAARRGLTPCGSCKPPPLLKAVADA